MVLENNVITASVSSAATYGPVTPAESRPDDRVALLVTTSATSGSPSLVYKLQGSVDGTNYTDVVLLPSHTDTAASSFTTSALGTVVYFVAQAHIRKYEKYQLVVSTCTTTTFNANLLVLQ